MTGQETEFESNNKGLARLELFGNITVLCIIGVFAVITLWGHIHARYILHNERFRWYSLTIVLAYMMDFITDVLFTMQIWFTDLNDNNGNKNIDLIILFCVCSFLLLVTIIVNMIQLEKSIKKWTNDNDTKDIIRPWIDKYFKLLYLLSIICGSSFAAVHLCTSNLFRWQLFDLGLNHRQSRIFKKQRIYTIVVFENVPQLIIVLFYSYLLNFENIGVITLLTVLFSLISLILAVFEFISMKYLLNNEIGFIIQFNVISNYLSHLSFSKFQEVENHRRKIVYELSKILTINSNSIELLKPLHTDFGTKLIFCITLGTDRDKNGIENNMKSIYSISTPSSGDSDGDGNVQYGTFYRCKNVLIEEIKNGKLSDMIQDCWIGEIMFLANAQRKNQFSMTIDEDSFEIKQKLAKVPQRLPQTSIQLAKSYSIEPPFIQKRVSRNGTV